MLGVIGWCDGPGKLPVPGRPKIWVIVGQGPIALAVDAGGVGVVRWCWINFQCRGVLQFG